MKTMKWMGMILPLLLLGCAAGTGFVAIETGTATNLAAGVGYHHRTAGMGGGLLFNAEDELPEGFLYVMTAPMDSTSKLAPFFRVNFSKPTSGLKIGYSLGSLLFQVGGYHVATEAGAVSMKGDRTDLQARVFLINTLDK